MIKHLYSDCLSMENIERCFRISSSETFRHAKFRCKCGRHFIASDCKQKFCERCEESMRRKRSLLDCFRK